ncbi:MAG TPA: L-threonylcarbamoyladenylate synthase, partial [Anaerolineae bacterium]|nr:L-threonylcarbamoyladenylate synthase [Anaerolineae bacterium]
AAHAYMPQAVAQLYALKQRPADLAVPLLLSSVTAMLGVADGIPAETWLLAERFWPGPLTLVLRRSLVVPDIVTNRRPDVAVRVPDHPLVRRIALQLGAPLATTSANLHGTPPATTAEKVMLTLGDRIPLILDGSCNGGVASTVVDLTVVPPSILRSGPITAEQLAALIEDVVVGRAPWQVALN